MIGQFPGMYNTPLKTSSNAQSCVSLHFLAMAISQSPYVSESSIQPFLQHDFDPAEYLNSTLPTLASTSARTAQTAAPTRSVALPELSSQLQTFLTQLSAQTSRLSTALTQLTDEILRSGGRLAYEVEVLRGETIGLTDSLENGLKKDIDVFTNDASLGPSANNEDTVEVAEDGPADGEPEYLVQLKSLTAVRSKLDSVIQLFGEAMQWPLAPSDMSITSSLISVSAPDATNDTRSREAKGKAYVESVRQEIQELLGSGDDVAGLEAAAERVEQLKQLADLWKGTAEEKARTKIVENLQKLVEERERALQQLSDARRPNLPSRQPDLRYGGADPTRSGVEGGYGFLQNLRNLKNDMYLD